jgi:hypothetical protein
LHDNIAYDTIPVQNEKAPTGLFNANHRGTAKLWRQPGKGSIHGSPSVVKRQAGVLGLDGELHLRNQLLAKHMDVECYALPARREGWRMKVPKRRIWKSLDSLSEAGREKGARATPPLPIPTATRPVKPLPSPEDRHRLREWWHSVLRDYGRYSCYAIFLTLTSDKELIRYVTEFGCELDLISGDNCLVIALASTGVRLPGFSRSAWEAAMKEYVLEGYSIEVAQLFDISFEGFPCLVVFQDIRSPKHILVRLKGMTAEEIAHRMRSLFSIIQTAVSHKQNPLTVIERHRNEETFREKGRSTISQLRSLAGKTFETAMEACIKAAVTK